MEIHILTPFYRKKLARTLIHYWTPHKIKWHPLMAPKDHMEFEEDWVIPAMVNELVRGAFVPGELTCFAKIDDFINTQQIINEDYYGVACDETMYEPGFFDVLRTQTTKVVVCSAYRGNKTPGTDPTDVAWYKHMNPPPICKVKSLHDLKRNNVGMGQYFVKGEILKIMPYAERIGDLQRSDDGHYIEELRIRYPNHISFLTNWYCFTNYFQYGRWTTTKTCIKSHWELPQYIGFDIKKEKSTLHEELT